MQLSGAFVMPPFIMFAAGESQVRLGSDQKDFVLELVVALFWAH